MTDPNRPADFPGWSAFFGAGAGESGILLLLDFDGTLSEIVENPDAAELRPGNAQTLDKLSRKPRLTVGIVSGRSLQDVADRIALSNLIYAGNHGMEIKGPGIRYLHPEVAAAVPGLQEIRSRVSTALAGIPGVQVEDKTLTLTVHYRRAPARYHEEVESIVRSVAHPETSTDQYRITYAKAAIEVRPAVDWHKGRALEFIRSRLAARAYTIYIGDDRTDEDAFEAAQAAGGCGIFVGPADAPSCARYRLESPAAVSAVLADLSLR